MKKLIALIVVSALTASAVFAQVSFGGDVSSFFVPYRATIDPDGKVKSTAAVQDPFGGPDLSTSIYVRGDSDLAGFFFSLRAAYGDGSPGNASTVRARPDMYVWIQPHNILKLYFGTMTNDTLAGKVLASDLAPYILDPEKADRIELGDANFNVFTQFNPNADGNDDLGNLFAPAVAAAAFVELTPIEGLFLGAFIAPELNGMNGSTSNGANTGQAGDFYEVEKIYKNMQFGLGYTIPNIGQVRAQYIGWRNVAEVAFNYNGAEGINIDFGVKIPWEGADKNDVNYKITRDIQAALAADLNFGEFGLMAQVSGAFGGKNSGTKYENGLDLVGYLVPSFDFGFAKMGVDLGFEYRADDKKDGETQESTGGLQFGAGLWLEKAFGAGLLKGGVVGRLPIDKWQGEELNTDIFIPILIAVSL